MNKQIVPGKPFIAKHKIQCKECGEILFSQFQGHFSQCKCEDFIFIDETKHYCRVGGKSEKIIFLEDKNSNEVERLNELDALLSERMRSHYPGVAFKLISVKPITLLHDSLELSLDDELLKIFSGLVRSHCTKREQMRIVVEYDILEEMEGKYE